MDCSDCFYDQFPPKLLPFIRFDWQFSGDVRRNCWLFFTKHNLKVTSQLSIGNLKWSCWAFSIVHQGISEAMTGLLIVCLQQNVWLVLLAFSIVHQSMNLYFLIYFCLLFFMVTFSLHLWIILYVETISNYVKLALLLWKHFELSEISFKWLGNHFELLNCLKLVPKPLWLSVWNFMAFPQILYQARD